MKNKNKKVAIHAELRKESQKFDGYLKYEVTITDQNGKLEVVPAYGKDLQDALGRVVHDDRVAKLEASVIKKVPLNGWVVAWFLGLALITITVHDNIENKNVGFYIMGAILMYALATVTVTNWFTLRNRAR